MITILSITSCVVKQSSNVSIPTQPLHYNTALWQGNATEIWDHLQHNSITKLQAINSTTSDADQKAWIELAIISKRNSTNTTALAEELLTWRAHYPTHTANALFPDNTSIRQLQQSSSPKQIALLLPMQGNYAASAQTIRAGFLNAYYATLSKTAKQNIKFYDTTKSKNVELLYQQAITDGADFIIGPLLKENVQQLYKSSMLTSATLALNYTDLSMGSLPTNLYEYGLLPEDEAAELADRATQTGLSHALIIAPANAWGKRLATAFSTRWQSLGGHIQNTWYFSAKTDFNQDITRLLKKNSAGPTNDDQSKQAFDVVFLFGNPQDAHTIIPLLHQYDPGKTPIYSTSTIYSAKTTHDNAIDGVIVCDIPWNMQNTKLQNANEVQTDRLYAVGQDAYLLSQSLSRLKELPNFPIYGTTGALTLSSSHQIHRRLPCMTIHNGLI